MNKRLIGVILCLAFLLGLAFPVYADDIEAQQEAAVTELRISTVDEFLDFAENCRLDRYSQALVVVLEADIDLSGTAFSGVPIFSGKFEGNRHTISGLYVTENGSALGLFRYLTPEAVVQDLTVEGEVSPGGSRTQIGGIAGHNAGSILNCQFLGTVSGASKVGGLVGSNAVTGIIENCRVEGHLQGDHFVGGVAGENYGVIRGCVNSAQINTTAQQNSVELSDITLDTLVNSEAANTVTDIGGIAGFSSGVIRRCQNLGNVGYQHMGYNVGGIAGTQFGYLAECENHAQIQGRKEVGGIVGQMEPVSVIEYSEDTLQILQGQLGTMTILVNRASGNIQTGADQINSQIGVLKDQALTAHDAVDALIPDAGSQELPDLDTILAAQNTLQSTISAMPGTVNSIASAAQDSAAGLGRDLQAISGQISAMGQTISQASENLGGSVTDISDQDTAETLTGKIENCINDGSILADLNAGGIAGAIAMENDLDILEDWQQNGEYSMNFESEVRAVILNCENRGTVTGTKQHLGGIAGWQSLGLVKNCTNSGTLDASGADYVGGISGLSTGFIRGSSAKCEIHGDTYVGGIAGSAGVVTDCLSMARICDGREKLGAILGSTEENSTQGEKPIYGNFYLSVSKDVGGIDGISYAGLAEPLELEAFLALECLPELFQSVNVRFLFEDGTEKCFSVTPGGALAASEIPAIPEKDGYTSAWEGLEAADLKNIVFDLTYKAVYAACEATIQSSQARENGLPILLAQGVFTMESAVSVSESDAAPILAGHEALAEVWRIDISASKDVTAVRFLLPAGLEANDLKLLVCGADGSWEEREYTADGSYLVFSWDSNDTTFAIAQAQSRSIMWVIAGAGAILIALAIFWVCRARTKKKKAKKAAAKT